MKKFSMAMLIALMGAGFVTACGSDSDDDNNDDANACQEVKCDAIANADGVAKGDDCACEYTCKNGFVKVDGENGSFTCEESAEEENDPCKDFAGCKGVSLPYVCTPTKDESAADGCKAVLSCDSDYTKVDDADNANGFRCLLPDDAVCLGDDECISGYCEVVDDETRKCAQKNDGGNGEGEGGEAKSCDPSDANACGTDELCITNVCKKADDLINTPCSTSTDTDYCFGNMKVYCFEGDSSTQYTYESCKDGASCVVDGLTAKCVAPEPVDPTVCSASTENSVMYACGGEEDEENWGGYTKSIVKTCTNNDGIYEWVEKSTDCNSYSGEACYPKHAGETCTNASPLDSPNGTQCHGINMNCASDYCDPDTDLCADKPVK